MGKSQAELDAANQYQAYNKGWLDGAKFTAMKPEIADHPNTLIKKAYSDGYSDGKHARNYALHGAAQRYGYTPSILRLANETDLVEPD